MDEIAFVTVTDTEHRVSLRSWADEHRDELALYAVLLALVFAGHLEASAGPDGTPWADPHDIRRAYDEHGDEVRFVPRAEIPPSFA